MEVKKAQRVIIEGDTIDEKSLISGKFCSKRAELIDISTER